MALPVMTIEGDVIAAHSYWTDDGSSIETEATIRTASGDVVVDQFGGSVDGIGMRQFPGAAILEPGMRVSVAAHHGLDELQQDHVVVDEVVIAPGLSPRYVRTGPTKAGHALYWEANCIDVTIDAAGTKAMSMTDEMSIIAASIATWNNDTAACSYMTTTVIGSQALEVGNDKINLIKIRDTKWERPAVGKTPAKPLPTAAAGITTAVYIDDAKSPRDGAILDADIEINNVNFDVTIDPDPSDAANAVLQNTLTHEIGHLHGLEHPCVVPPMDPPRIDNTGAPVPDCSAALPPKITEATMYNYQNPGETKKETLTDDDIQSMCDIYPKASDPGVCAPPKGGSGSGGCCSASGERADVSMLLGGITFGLLFAGRRRKKLSPAK